MDTQKAKRELLQLRSRLLGRDEEVIESLAVPLEEESGEGSYDQHMADIGTVTLTRELDLSLQDNTEHLLAQVNRALEKIEEGTYGLCDRCGRPIEESRLEAMPYAVLDLEHQRELERSRGI
jgi:RNA polymerase-binding transcription factor DksA